MTREDLENERATLVDVLRYLEVRGVGAPRASVAIGASIARLDALLTLTDEDCRYMSDELLPTAPPAWHVVAAIVRRTA